MGYIVIPYIAAIVLVIHHVLFTNASRLSKLVSSIVVAGSLVIWHFFPRWLVVATILQSATGVYLLICLKVRAAGRL